MALQPEIVVLHRAVTGVVASLRQQLDDAGQLPDLGSDEVGELCRAVEHVVWARDVALVLARRADVPWFDLATATATPDSTLYGRYRRALDRETP